MMRTFVIGDIHGGLKALEQVFAQIDIQSNDQFIFLGDYVDGWSESAQVISFLIDFGEKYDAVFVKGNHDQFCEDWLKTGKRDTLWLNHGGLATIESYNELSDQKKEDHIRFFEYMVDFHLDNQGVITGVNKMQWQSQLFTKTTKPKLEAIKTLYSQQAIRT